VTAFLGGQREMTSEGLGIPEQKQWDGLSLMLFLAGLRAPSPSVSSETKGRCYSELLGRATNCPGSRRVTIGCPVAEKKCL
jgi:hypothetical protein